jgi:hypothetical protein
MVGYNTYKHGKITRKIPVWLSLSQTSKKCHVFFFLICKIREQSRFCPGERVDTMGEGRWWGKEVTE